MFRVKLNAKKKIKSKRPSFLSPEKVNATDRISFYFVPKDRKFGMHNSFIGFIVGVGKKRVPV